MADPDPYAALGTVEAPTAAPANDPYASMGTAEQPQLHTYSTIGPDRKEVRFQLPSTATDAEVQQAAAKATGSNLYLGSIVKRDGSPALPPPPQNHSMMDGLALGVWNAIDNGASLFNHIPGLAAVDQWSHDHLGTPTVGQFNQQMDARRADNDRTGFQTAGNILATLPVGSARLGLLANGAIQGALSSDDHGLGGQAASAIEGGVGSLVGGKALHAIAGVVAPRLSAAQTFLRNAGVQFTPGQLAGGAAKHVEDAMTHLPFVGDAINAARRQGYTQFTRGGVNDALSHIGDVVPERVETGHGAVAYARKSFNNAYQDALSKSRLDPNDADGQFWRDIDGVMRRSTDGTLGADTGKQLTDTVQNVIAHRIGGAGGEPLSGEAVLSIVSELRTRAANETNPAYKKALNDLTSVVNAGAARSSAPEVGLALRNASNGYAKFSVLRQAAQATKGTNGTFSPSQLETAARIGDDSVGNGRFSEGAALMQPYALAGSEVLPSKIGDSGTGPRVLANSAVGLALGGSAALHAISPGAAAGTALATGLGSAAYSPAAIGLLNRTLARQAGPQAQSAATLLRSLAPIAGVAGAAVPTSIQATQR